VGFWANSKDSLFFSVNFGWDFLILRVLKQDLLDLGGVGSFYHEAHEEREEKIRENEIGGN